VSNRRSLRQIQNEVVTMAKTVAETLNVTPGNRMAIAGLVFTVLYAASYFAVRTLPKATWSDDEILAYYASSDVSYARIVTLYLVPFAGIAFVWFLAAFRDRVSKLAGAESMMLSTVQILSGSIYVAMQFSAAASIVTVVLTLDAGTPDSASVEAVRPFLVLGDTILVVFALRAAAVFMISGTTRALRSGLFRQWHAYLSYALALVLLLTASEVRATALIFPLWIGAVSILILLRRPGVLTDEA
jgi:hypothetical protein